MVRMTWIAAALLAATAGVVRADYVPFFAGVPDTYTPGTQFTFSVLVPNIHSFSRYSIELDFETTQVHPTLGLSAAPGPANYPFPTTANFQSSSPTVLDATGLSLTISDSTSPSVNVTPGVNDLLAVVTVTPGADLTGPLTISVDGNSRLLYNTEIRPGDTLPNPVTVDQAAVVVGPPTPVPAPPGLVALGIGGLALLVRRCVLRPA